MVKRQFYQAKQKCSSNKQQGTTTICCNECYDVDIDTVGMYTGLTDRNGVKIFKGDIVEYEEQDGIARYSVVWNEKLACFAVAGYKGMIIGDFAFYTSKKCKNIGNIHDNPGLLKGEENE